MVPRALIRLGSCQIVHRSPLHLFLNTLWEGAKFGICDLIFCITDSTPERNVPKTRGYYALLFPDRCADIRHGNAAFVDYCSTPWTELGNDIYLVYTWNRGRLVFPLEWHVWLVAPRLP